MARYLKQRAFSAESNLADGAVKAAVEAILDDVSRRGEATVRDLSARSDRENGSLCAAMQPPVQRK